jgi:hypothetical protein
MLRRSLLVAAAILLPGGLLVVTTPEAAWALPSAHGIANCLIVSGNGTVSPGLTPTGSAGGVKIHFTASLTSPAAGCPNSNVTSPAGDVILGGTVTGSGFYNPVPATANGSSCANFAGPDVVGKIKVTIKWLMSGAPVANTTIVYQHNPGTVVAAPNDTITLKAPPGTAAKAGSFATPAGLNTVQLKTTLPGPGCGPGPWWTFTITGGNVLV